jgi:hypothetical protein
LNLGELNSGRVENLKGAMVKKLSVFGDLHTEFAGHDPPKDHTGVDVVVASGDIGVGVSGLNWLLDSFPRYLPVVYVPGNKEEVANYFVWRQKDWMRNSVSMMARACFSHKELQGKSQAAMHDLLNTKGINWAHL